MASEAKLKAIGLAVTAALGIAGLAFTAFELVHSVGMSAKKPFLEQQMQLCTEASGHAAAIATSEAGSQPLATAWSGFDRLYFGPLAIVENRAVANAMVCFRAEAKAESRPGCGAAEGLKNRSLAIALACRDLVLGAWGVDMADVGLGRD